MEVSTPKSRRGIIIFAIIASVILYMAGVFSGLYANTILKEETQADISSLKEETKQDLTILKRETQQDLGSLQDYVNQLDGDLRSMQLEQNFAEILTDDQQCEFSRISLQQLISELGYYWDKLPFRLEEYELYNEPTPEYVQLKEDYMRLSIRIWTIAKNLYDKCDANVVHGLHFYDATCDKCVSQGEQLDLLRNEVVAQGSELVLFPIDFDSDDLIVAALKQYYGITETPAVLINDQVYQGRLYSADELLEAATN